ncbi:probable complex I intermediate-associated protein 30, mitochondrial [Fopius arisanus]|uniref:CG7598_0 protein n=1 Tax=Fopius arisanus TaxID=64838 RepID=A0A0C9R8N4_9HYME|nr:PREDICTED: probable complex I intermediate-associated protein 30, mitochondrial [Fopius arisanus]
MVYTMVTPLVARLVNMCNLKNQLLRHLHISQKALVFHEVDPKSGYPHISDYKEEKLNPLQRIYKGYFQFIEECKKLGEEIKDSLHVDPTLLVYPEEVDVQWKFNGDPKILDKWIVTCDSDYNHGFSKATLELSSTGAGVFSGRLDTRVPKDGILNLAGFCNIRSVVPRGPFKIVKPFQWFRYTHLILRVRGDGRSYMIYLHLKNEYDIMWADLHGFPLYTRGGPYWQYVKIPFSKFFLTNRGRIQDSQAPIRLWEVLSIGITATGIPGPFNLEIDYIGVQQDPKHREEFAYEMYKPPHPYYI